MRALSDDLYQHVIEPVFQNEQLRPDARTHIFINPEGLIIDGGPSLHSGLTGRKNAVDTYGEYSRHAESALSGKDPSRIDRVGAYAARYAAKNVVAAGLAQACEVHLAYSLGIARPVSVQVDSFGTGRVPMPISPTVFKLISTSARPGSFEHSTCAISRRCFVAAFTADLRHTATWDGWMSGCPGRATDKAPFLV